MSLDVTLVDGDNYVFDANITHNLNTMADVAGIYEAVWHPDRIGICRADQLIEPLEKGIALMERHPARFQKYDSPNGWGLYKHFMPWRGSKPAADTRLMDVRDNQLT